jgi:CMP-N-acetylneuraminic acid synthetase
MAGIPLNSTRAANRPDNKPEMLSLGVILARAGSKGLPDKCVRSVLGRAMIQYTFDHALASRLLDGAVLTTDSAAATELAHERGVEVISRPPELASDTATVDAAARHAVEVWEVRHDEQVDAVVLLAANIPVRPAELIDRGLRKLYDTCCDSVRSVAPVDKRHPDWMVRMDGDEMRQYRENSIHRRQDLEPLHYLDGAMQIVTRRALFAALDAPDDQQAFLGRDRRALVLRPDDVVDVDEMIDLYVAEAILRSRREHPRIARMTQTASQ